MAIFFVSRHSGARDWGQRQGVDATFVDRLDLTVVTPSDTVMGTLPAHVAARVCALGARYLHLAMDVPEERRGTDLTADDMERFGARLVELDVRRRGGTS